MFKNTLAAVFVAALLAVAPASAQAESFSPAPAAPLVQTLEISGAAGVGN